jgi:hypothetical protein
MATEPIRRAACSITAPPAQVRGFGDHPATRRLAPALEVFGEAPDAGEAMAGLRPASGSGTSQSETRLPGAATSSDVRVLTGTTARSGSRGTARPGRAGPCRARRSPSRARCCSRCRRGAGRRPSRGRGRTRATRAGGAGRSLVEEDVGSGREPGPHEAPEAPRSGPRGRRRAEGTTDRAAGVDGRARPARDLIAHGLDRFRTRPAVAMARLQPVRAGQPLPGPPPAAAASDQVRPVRPNARAVPTPRGWGAATTRPIPVSASANS